MEAGAIVALVLGSNAIMGVVNYLMMKRQIKHSEKQLERKLQEQREADERKWRREVGSEPLVMLRNELARMAAKGERVVFLAKSIMSHAYMDSKYRGWIKKGKMPNELKEALDDWNTYMESGEFQQVLFMQRDVNLVERVLGIRDKYAKASGVMNITPWADWLDEKEKEKEFEAIGERIRENIRVIVGNRDEIAKVQSELKKWLEEL